HGLRDHPDRAVAIRPGDRAGPAAARGGTVTGRLFPVPVVGGTEQAGRVACLAGQGVAQQALSGLTLAVRALVQPVVALSPLYCGLLRWISTCLDWRASAPAGRRCLSPGSAAARTR